MLRRGERHFGDLQYFRYGDDTLQVNADLLLQGECAEKEPISVRCVEPEP